MPRKFYKTIITLEILSEEQIPDDMTLDNIYAEAMDGGYSMRQVGTWKETELSGKQAVKALKKQGSDPGFFNLTNKGEELN